MPLPIALSSARPAVASEIVPNKSEDLAKNNSENSWVDDTLIDFVAGFNTGAQPLEDTRENASPVI